MRRTIEMRVVKKSKDGETEEEIDMDLEERAAIISLCFDRAVRKVGEAVITYVVVDTIRKVVVHRLTK